MNFKFRRLEIPDVIVVEGNPLEDIRLLQDPQRIRLVMKEGVIESNKGIRIES